MRLCPERTRGVASLEGTLVSKLPREMDSNILCARYLIDNFVLGLICCLLTVWHCWTLFTPRFGSASLKNECKNSGLPVPVLRVKDPNESLEKCLQAVEGCTHFKRHDVPFALAFVGAPVCRVRGQLPWSFAARQLLCLSLFVFVPVEAAPPEEARTSGPNAKTPNQSLPTTLRTTDKAGPFLTQKAKMAITRSSPTLPQCTPQSSTAAGGNRVFHREKVVTGVCGSLDPGPSHPRTPGWFQKVLTQASAQSRQAGPSRVVVRALACADSAQSN